MLLVKLYLRLGKTAALLSTYGGIKNFQTQKVFESTCTYTSTYIRLFWTLIWTFTNVQNCFVYSLIFPHSSHEGEYWSQFPQSGNWSTILNLTPWSWQDVVHKSTFCDWITYKKFQNCVHVVETRKQFYKVFIARCIISYTRLVLLLLENLVFSLKSTEKQKKVECHLCARMQKSTAKTSAFQGSFQLLLCETRFLISNAAVQKRIAGLLCLTWSIVCPWVSEATWIKINKDIRWFCELKKNFSWILVNG